MKPSYRVSVQIMSAGGEMELVDKVFHVESLDVLGNNDRFGYDLAEQAKKVEKEEGLELIEEYDDSDDLTDNIN